MVQQRLSMITLGCHDLSKTRVFFETLGWQLGREEHADNVLGFTINNGTMVLGVFPFSELAKDAAAPTANHPVSNIVLSYNVPHKEDVADVLMQAEQAGATILKPAQDAFWGGFHGHFADINGHVWEVAFNPFMPLDAENNFKWEKPNA